MIRENKGEGIEVGSVDESSYESELEHGTRGPAPPRRQAVTDEEGLDVSERAIVEGSEDVSVDRCTIEVGDGMDEAIWDAVANTASRLPNKASC